jgi:hypothetical protein
MLSADGIISGSLRTVTRRATKLAGRINYSMAKLLSTERRRMERLGNDLRICRYCCGSSSSGSSSKPEPNDMIHT